MSSALFGIGLLVVLLVLGGVFTYSLFMTIAKEDQHDH